MSFFRLIPIALNDYEYRIDKDVIKFSYEGGMISIATGEEKHKKIASLKMPMLKVSFNFQDIGETDIKNFLQHFLKVYQRGGG